MQEAALKHAQILGFGSFDLFSRNLTWVVTRFELQVLKNISWDNEIIVKTWSRGMIGPYAFRDFEIFDSHDQIIAKASSSWVPIDLGTRKPVVFKNEDFHDDAKINVDVGIDPSKIHLGKDDGILIKSFYVNNSDIDINHHVNNTKYVQWLYDAVTFEEQSSWAYQTIAVNYLGEARANDKINLYRKDSAFYACLENGNAIFKIKLF